MRSDVFADDEYQSHESRHRSSIPSGGARRDRTDDLMLAKHALSQLSYGPVPEDEMLHVDQGRANSKRKRTRLNGGPGKT